MIDLLYARYGAGARDILTLDFEPGMELIAVAYEASQDEKLFSRWVQGHQRVCSFDDFKTACGVHPGANRVNHYEEETEESILIKVRDIINGGL